MIKYIGSKRTLLADLVAILRAFPEFHSAIDLFSGTSRVGHAFKRAGYCVFSNDYNAYAQVLATCYVEADRERVETQAGKLIAEFNQTGGKPGYFTETFCERSRFFQPHNGARIDAIREEIERKGLDPILRSVVLVSLMEAADRVDSTCGLQMAYVKTWAPRSFNDLTLRMPDVLPSVAAGDCRAYRMEALQAAGELTADVAYLDPPYNQHSYLANYHIWESLILWDKPEVYGVACKRIDVRERKSVFNSRPAHAAAFADVIAALKCALIVVSFNNEGYHTREQVEQILASRGRVFVTAKDFKRYVGAQIGIYNPSGERVGEVSHVRNQEYIYLVATGSCPNRSSVEERLATIAAARDVAASVPVRTLFDDMGMEGIAPDAAQRGEGSVELVEKVVACLRAKGSLSARALEVEVGVSAYRVKQALQILEERGEVRVDGRRRGAVFELLSGISASTQTTAAQPFQRDQNGSICSIAGHGSTSCAPKGEDPETRGREPQRCSAQLHASS